MRSIFFFSREDWTTSEEISHQTLGQEARRLKSQASPCELYGWECDISIGPPPEYFGFKL
jgi:hypothetical protein